MLIFIKFHSKKKENTVTDLFSYLETIGSIGYISKKLKYFKINLIAGFILTCLGDERCVSYMPSRKGDTLSDRIALKNFKKINYKKKYYTWLDRASDEKAVLFTRCRFTNLFNYEI